MGCHRLRLFRLVGSRLLSNASEEARATRVHCRKPSAQLRSSLRHPAQQFEDLSLKRPDVLVDLVERAWLRVVVEEPRERDLVPGTRLRMIDPCVRPVWGDFAL